MPKRVTRRSILFGVGGFLAGFASAFYLLPKSMWLGNLRMKLRRAEVPGPPRKIHLGDLQPGQTLTVGWKEKTIYVTRRTPEMIATIEAESRTLRDPESEWSQQPDEARNIYRSIRKEIFVVDSTCTHLGCPVALVRRDDLKQFPDPGYFCACHGAQFDLAGRVRKSSPAPRNLVVPPHFFKDDSTLVLGERQT